MLVVSSGMQRKSKREHVYIYIHVLELSSLNDMQNKETPIGLAHSAHTAKQGKELVFLGLWYYSAQQEIKERSSLGLKVTRSAQREKKENVVGCRKNTGPKRGGGD